MRILSSLVVTLLLFSGTLVARDLREQQRIDYLINSLGALPGAVFIRNGTEYNAADAQKHLRRKLAYAGERIKTAEEFVKYCASQSSISHQPYRIRFSNGHTVDTSTFFLSELKDFKPPN